MSQREEIDFETLTASYKRLRKMSVPIEGGCLCGAVRYKCTDAPIWSANCHCKSCQKLTGSSFSTAFTVKTECFGVNDGDTIEFDRKAESGQTVTIVRCKRCGTWIFSKRSGNSEFRSILASTLDKPENFVLISDVYVSEAADWTVFDAELSRFAKMPEDQLRR